MPNGLEQTTNLQPDPEPQKRSWANVVLIFVLVLLVAAAVVVGFLILRSRGALPRSAEPTVQEQGIVVPSDTVPIESYTPERPWQEGDPIPEIDESEVGGFEPDAEAES